MYMLNAFTVEREGVYMFYKSCNQKIYFNKMGGIVEDFMVWFDEHKCDKSLLEYEYRSQIRKFVAVMMLFPVMKWNEVVDEEAEEKIFNALLRALEDIKISRNIKEFSLEDSRNYDCTKIESDEYKYFFTITEYESEVYQRFDV